MLASVQLVGGLVLWSHQRTCVLERIEAVTCHQISSDFHVAHGRNKRSAMCELSQRKLAAVLLDSEEPGMPKVRSFPIEDTFDKPNDLRWLWIFWIGFRCQGMPQTTVTTWQRAVPAAKAAGRIQGCKWCNLFFRGKYGDFLSHKDLQYFNPFWARLQRVRKKTFNCAGGFLIFLGTSTVVPWTSLGKPRHYASDPLKLSYASQAGG